MTSAKSNTAVARFATRRQPTSEPLPTALFDFELPAERIALRPTQPRDAARLLVVHPDGPAALSDRKVHDLAALLQPGDAMVFNDTRVIPAELKGRRRRGAQTSSISLTLHRRLDGQRWRAFARPARRLRAGDEVTITAPDLLPDHTDEADALSATVLDQPVDGEVTLKFAKYGAALDRAIMHFGRMPLPPYIASRRATDPGDVADYQTIYAKVPGAIAAPTAGLHFTDELFAALDARGVSRHFLTLHVGAGTFLPVKTDDASTHHMHSEWGEITAQTAETLNAVRAGGGRLIAVGTTAVRLLESASSADGRIKPFSGETDIFITPGYRFRAIDMMLTNFHLPRSTLFMLVASFSGLQPMQDAYAHAIAADYRFYSYGDACLLHPGGAR